MSGCNEQNCICPKTDCERHGKCCECINHHRKKNGLVYCMKQIVKEQEKKKKNLDKKGAFLV